MNGTGDDKTRLKKPTSAKDGNRADRTKISPKPPVSNDKTRIHQKNAGQPSTSDTTQYKPSNKKNTNQVPVTTNIALDLDSHNYSFEEKSAGHHGVLKERFILAKIIGSGGMGVVYKAKDLLKVEAKDRDPYVAIKVLSEEFKTHPEAFISLQRESRKSQRIAHPNIVNVFDFDRDGDIVFMTMEYMDGKPLDQIIRQYKSTGLPSDDAWKILKSMCQALIHAHAENVIHSDLKPGNIFVTNKDITKIFDFGIARAVAKATHLGDSSEDRTVFDASSLGALTPAYASLEMLEGKTPDLRDDIYALGCVAYELFTGEHPFNKVPADEAEKQGLIPKRITSISKRQWHAIKQALAFNREDRIASVDEFYNLITTKIKRSYAIQIIVLLLSVILVSGYFLLTQNITQGVSESEIRDKVEYELQLNFHKNTIDSLLKNPSFSVSWEEQLWTEFGIFNSMLKSIDNWMLPSESAEMLVWFSGIDQIIYKLYLKKIRQFREAGKFSKTKKIIENAARYTQDFQELEIEKQLLAEAIEKYEKNKKVKISKKIKANSAKKKKIVLFNIALKNVNQQLQCQSKLNMRNLDVAIRKLKSYNFNKYNKLQADIIHRLAACITELGKAFPEKALEYKKSALRIFNHQKKIVAIRIIPRDPCNISIAGLGGRGQRTVCQDKLKGIIGTGPDLIVVFGKASITTFAMGKYEVSIKDLNMFCNKSSVCKVIKNKNENLPATNIKFSVVKAYLKWLSNKTHKRYRLPTKTEWLYAAITNRKSLDPNRNCFMSTRGIEKGEELFEIKVGKPNKWGMVNYIGNAQEWVYDKGRRLVAVGGSYNSLMEQCNFNTIEHVGNANVFTGFRVLREMKK